MQAGQEHAEGKALLKRVPEPEGTKTSSSKSRTMHTCVDGSPLTVRVLETL